jgi:hypothetical protein
VLPVVVEVFAATRFRAMEHLTILNRCHHFLGFVYHRAGFSPNRKSIDVSVRPRKRSAAICSRCHQPAPVYDQLGELRFELIPLGDFSYSCCTRCGASTAGAAAPLWPRKFRGATRSVVAGRSLAPCERREDSEKTSFAAGRRNSIGLVT